MAALLGVLLLLAMPVSAAEPLRLGAGPHLFIDDYLVESQSNLKRVAGRPERLPEPVVTGPEDTNWQPWFSVLRDPATGRFRIWYNGWDGKQTRLAYLESPDGIRWERPHRFLEVPAPITFGATIFDEGRSFADPARRFKALWWSKHQWFLTSPDGFRWDLLKGFQIPNTTDITHFLWDPIRKRYLAILGTPSVREDGYKGGTRNAPEGYRRLVGQSTSADLVNWTPVKRIVVADSKDEGVTEYYGIGAVAVRGDLLVGMLKVLRDDVGHDFGAEVQGIGYTALAWSRDGETWQRDRIPFLDRNPRSGAWDRAMVWVDSQVVVGDETYLYYGGYARGHKVERYKERQIGLARMPRDRYTAREAAGAAGRLRTPVLTLDAHGITVNAAVQGTLRVRVVSEAGKPVPGFNWTDCAQISGDSVAHPVRWKASLTSLRGKPLRLEFELNRGLLYGFDLE